MSVWLVSCCIRFPDFRAVIARKTLKSLKESTWNTVRRIVKDWGLLEEVNYKVNNLAGTLTFWNGSVIIMLEMADLPSDCLDYLLCFYLRDDWSSFKNGKDGHVTVLSTAIIDEGFMY